MSELFCPKCGSHNVESEEEAMEGVWMYHTHYCQDCGCSFKVLRKSRKT
jgi:predicted nucleic-acid-binding Zn-ribbon protein